MNNFFYFVLGGLIFLGVLGIFALPVESGIPPTVAFSSINGTDGSINATNYRTTLQLIEGTNIDFDFDNTDKQLTISSFAGGNTTVYENNTASSSGHGKSIVLPKIGIDLPFKGIACTGSIDCIVNATDITIDYTATGGGNATNIDDLGDVVAQSVAQFSILYYNGVNWLDQVFKINTFDTTCSGTDKVSRVAINNQTGDSIITCSTDQTGSGGAVSLSANVTRTAPPASAHGLVFTIPLTANSGNSIKGMLVAQTSVAGVAVQAGANVTSLQSRGWCHWITPLTISTEAIDNLVINTVLTGSTTDTGETTWLPAINVPQIINFDCTITSGATPGNLKIWIQPETTGTVTAKAGSMYIKTP